MAQEKGKSGDRVDKVLAKLRRAGVEHVRFELPDMHGSARSKQVPIEWFTQFAREGINMYGGVVALDSASQVVPGSRYNEEVNYRDQTLSQTLPRWPRCRGSRTPHGLFATPNGRRASLSAQRRAMSWVKCCIALTSSAIRRS
jgi:hypothetical protein